MEEKKALPDGIEWPRFEDETPVRFGDMGLDVHGRPRPVMSVKFTQAGLTFIGDDMGGTWWGNDTGPMEDLEVDHGKRVKRPPVLAADGEPLEVGQTVYHIADGKEYTVEELFEAGAMVTPDGITGGRCRAEYLTHHRPVIASDGKPLREGETVWSVSGLTEYEVLGFENGLVYVENSRNKFVCSYREPKELTHDGQDSFARIWDDAFSGIITWQEMERRARALAERGQ